MAHDKPPPPVPDLGAIEFESTDFADARAAHDMPPPGLATYWASRRRPALVTDRALTGRSLDWLMRLPKPLQPKALCERFPRIVNSLSETWDDTGRSLEVFEHLLHDRRVGRRGFPLDVQREIEALCEHRALLASEQR